MPFPVGPSDGQEYQTQFGSRYKYYAADEKWVKIGFPLSGVTGPRGLEGGFTGIMNITMDGGTNSIPTGTKANVGMPYQLTLDSWTLLASETGTLYLELTKGTYDSYPPSTEIHAGYTGPNIVTNIKNQETGLSHWPVTSFNRGDVMRVEVVGAQAITNATLSFNYHKS